MPIGSGIVYNTGDLILSQVSSSGTAFLETKIAAATSSLIYFDSTARINSASLNSITVGTASYVSGSRSIITNLTASNISASGTGSFGIVGIGTVNPAYKLDVNGNANFTNGFYTNTDASSTSYFVGANGTRPIIFQNNTAASYDFGFKFSDSNTFTIVGGNTLANPTTDLVSFTYDGKVGIRTTSSNDVLEVVGSGAAGIRVSRAGVSTQYSTLSAGSTGPTLDASAAVGGLSLGVGGSSYLYVNSIGNVGIGSSSPSYKLDVSGSIRASEGEIIATGNNAAFRIYRTTGINYLDWASGQNLYLGTVTSEGGAGRSNKMVILDNGNVGIGTTSPVSALTVQGDIIVNYNSSTTNFVRRTFATSHAAGNRGATLWFSISDGSETGIQIVNTGSSNPSYNSQYIAFHTHEGAVSAAERMRIDPLGNIGIGTTNPVSKLQVNGNISGSSFTSSISNAVGFLGTSSWAQNVVSASFATTAQTANALNASNTYTVAGLTSAYVDVNGSSAPTTGIYRPSTKTLGLSADSTLIFKISNVSAPATSSIETGNFLVSGSVGIGTTSPSAKLTIVDNTNGGTINLVGRTSDDTATINFRATGDASTYAYVSPDTNEFRLYHNDGFMSFYPGGTEKVRITSGGNVGIGTTSVNHKLDMWGATGTTFNMANTDDSGRGGKLTFISSSAAGRQFYVGTNSSIYNLVFGIDSIEKMRLDTNGNVGIGVTSPSGRLHITGSATSNETLLYLSKGSASISQNYINAVDQAGSINYRVTSDINGYSQQTLYRSGTSYVYHDAYWSSWINNANYTQGGLALGTGSLTHGYALNISRPATSGSLYVSGSSIFTGSVSINGSLNATASWANNVVSASYATTANALSSMNISQFTNNSKYHYHRTDISSLSSSATNLVQPLSTFDYNNATNGPGAAWYNYFSSTHGDYLTSLIANQHRTANWYVAYREGSAGTPTNPVWYALFHEGNYTTYTVTKTGTGASGTWSITSSIANALNTANNYTVGSLTSTTQLGGSSGTLVSYVTPGVYATGTSTGNAIGIISNTTFANNGAIANIGLNQSSSNANDITARVHMTIGGWYQNSGTGIPIYLGNGYTIESSPTMVIVPADANGGGNVGIGTTNPIAKLHVVGNISGSSFTSSISNAVGFLGTSSWANNVVSSSYATTAQTANALNTGNSYTIAGLTNNGTLSMGSGYQILATTGTAPIPGIAFVGDTNTGIYAPAADTLGFSISGSERVRIDSSGNLLIGTTTSPSNTGLSIGSTGTVRQILGGMQNTSWRIREKSAIDWCAWTTNINDAGTQDDATKSSWLTQQGFGNGNDAWRLGRYPAGSSTLSTFIYINSSGNVGIGTTDPTQNKLLVYNSSTATDYTASTFGSGTGYFDNKGGISIYNPSQTTNNFSSLDFYIDQTNYSNVGAARIICKTGARSTGGSFDTSLIFLTHNAAGTWNQTIIDNSGNVGIGTTNATDKLTVYGAMASYKTGADTVQTQVYLANGGNTRAFNLQLNSGGTGLDLWSYNSANAWLKHTTFDYDGRVGIGTAAPAAKLEISGSSNSALLHVKSPISGAILYVSGSGAVGINTSTVGAYTLQVNGSFAATTKSFVIDHPTKAGKRLIYGSLESPYHGIRLTGRDTLKDGKCKIQLPDYIYKLILHDSVNIQLTGIKCNKTLYVDDINIPENYFTIAYDKALFESYKDYDFFWDFTAIRADVPELNTEL